MAEAASRNDIQYLTFTLGRELFALDIGSVREVLELVNITRVPRTPDYIRGVINLRGRAVPVVDLKLKFGMGATERTVNTCIIIVEVSLDGEDVVLGALADSVQEVYDMESSQIEPPPRMGTPIKAEFIRGMGKGGEQFIIILEIGKVFTSLELAALGQGMAETGMETVEA
jgi:purine-binding chemotaxis protein CheW